MNGPLTIGQMIEHTITSGGLSQIQAAKDLGCSKMTLLHWMREFTVPSIGWVDQIARFTGRPASEVLTAILRDGFGLDADIESVEAIPG